MRVAVIGAGVAGLVTAQRLTQFGHVCDVYERWPGLGGQVATLDIGEADPLERYYHHLFQTDRHIVRLYEDLDMGDQMEWIPSSVAMFSSGGLYPFTGPVDLLRFKPMPFLARVRMGAAVLLLQMRAKEVQPFEEKTAKDWIVRNMGPSAWRAVWGPLLRNKFGSRYEQISMAWLWSKLTLRRRIDGEGAREEKLGYPRGGWQPLLDRLEREIEAGGGSVLIDRPAKRIERSQLGFRLVSGAPESYRRGHEPSAFEEHPETLEYDAVVSTVPGDVFQEMLDPGIASEVGPDYMHDLLDAEYHTALCLLLELDRQFSPYYWTNIADDLPFVGIIEHTNFIPPERYGGRRFLYVANYVEPDDELLSLDPGELLERYTPGLRRVNPAWDSAWVKSSWLFREAAAQPIVTVGYHRRIPPLATPAPGLFVANTTQIYPEDRGTNYSVRLGWQVAAEVDPKAIHPAASL